MHMTSPLLGPAPSQNQALMMSSTKRHGLANPDLQMPPRKINDGRDGIHDDVRLSVSKVNVQQQLGVSPSALVSHHTTIASAALEGQLSLGFHPSALAS